MVKKHIVKTKHPRYQVPNYDRGRGGGQQTLGGRPLNPPPVPQRDLKAYGMSIKGRAINPDGSTIKSEADAMKFAEKMAQTNKATIIIEKAKYKTRSDEPPSGRVLRCWRVWHDPYDDEVKVIKMSEWKTPIYKRDRQRRFAEHGQKWTP